MSKSKQKRIYLLFPIVLLQHKSIYSCFTAAMEYALYARWCGEKGEMPKEEVAKKILGITYGNLELAFENGKQIFDSIQNSPLVMIDKDTIFKYYKNINLKLDDELVFRAFIALRAILGKNKKLANSNNDKLRELMGLNAMELKITDYKLNKIKEVLQLNWGLKYYAHYTHGFWFSFNLSLSQLISKVEERKHSNKIKRLEEEKARIRENVMQSLNS